MAHRGRSGRTYRKGGSNNDLEPGDIAQDKDGDYGHVGFLTDVIKDSGGNIVELEVAELNKGGVGNYSKTRYTAKNPQGKFSRGNGLDWDNFIDLNGAGKGLNGEAIGESSTTPPASRFTGSDFDRNRNADLILTTREGAGMAAAMVLRSTGVSLLEPEKWRTLDGYGWDGLTPLVGDVTGDAIADYVFLTNEGVHGMKAFVAKSKGQGTETPALWWNGTGYGYTGMKANLGDMDRNNADDLVLTARRGDGTADVLVLPSTWAGFMAPENWRILDGFGWDGITPFTADVNGEGYADYIFVTNEANNGMKVFVAKSTGRGTESPALWWNGVGYSYDGIKAAMR